MQASWAEVCRQTVCYADPKHKFVGLIKMNTLKIYISWDEPNGKLRHGTSLIEANTEKRHCKFGQAVSSSWPYCTAQPLRIVGMQLYAALNVEASCLGTNVVQRIDAEQAKGESSATTKKRNVLKIQYLIA